MISTTNWAKRYKELREELIDQPDEVVLKILECEARGVATFKNGNEDLVRAVNDVAKMIGENNG